MEGPTVTAKGHDAKVQPGLRMANEADDWRTWGLGDRSQVEGQMGEMGSCLRGGNVGSRTQTLQSRGEGQDTDVLWTGSGSEKHFKA